MNRRCDFLIIGSGAAGLYFALKVAQSAKVVVVTKDVIDKTNTQKAQGGIASVTYEPDSFSKHINDTLECGSHRCCPDAVKQVVECAPHSIQQLIDWGVDFDKNNNRYDLAREGGHTEHRILHYKDSTGAEIQRVLVEKVLSHPNIEILEHHFAIDLLTQHHLGDIVTKHSNNIECYGAYVLNVKTEKVITLQAKCTVVATGGVGNIYDTSTNPIVATGDGIAMVHRAKGKVDNMEFIQFHPTSLYHPGEHPSFLITEAMRGFGAILKTQSGDAFMDKYHPMGSLAPRDIVARSIDYELKSHGEEFVYLDVTHKPAKDIIHHFPNIYQKCLSIGIDITKDMIPVVPAAHYACGGVRVDLDAKTSIKCLYAIGESSSTGLHGANRLASNSLSEAVVYAQKAAQSALSVVEDILHKDGIPDWDYDGTSHPEEYVLVTQSYKEIQQIMSNYVGIVRSNARLDRAFRRMEIIHQETEELYRSSTLSVHLCELRNMIAVAYLIIKHARKQTQSVGLHYSLDYPLS